MIQFLINFLRKYNMKKSKNIYIEFKMEKINMMIKQSKQFLIKIMAREQKIYLMMKIQ